MTHWGWWSQEANLGTSPATSRMRAASDRPVDDPVDGDDAHVLAVGGGGQAEEGAQNAHDALAHDAAESSLSVACGPCPWWWRRGRRWSVPH